MEGRSFTYGSVTLHPSDVRLFGDGRWLNDNCLSFYIEYLSRVYQSTKYVFVEPGTAFLISMEEDLEDLRSALHRLDLVTPEYVLLPVNDNTDPEREAGGSHWTLLVISKRTGTGYHLNSMGAGGMNSHQARVIGTRLGAVMGVAVTMREVEVRPSQRNGFDCGVYVLTVGEMVVREIVAGGDEREVIPRVYGKVSPEDVTRKRREICKLVTDLTDTKFNERVGESW